MNARRLTTWATAAAWLVLLFGFGPIEAGEPVSDKPNVSKPVASELTDSLAEVPPAIGGSRDLLNLLGVDQSHFEMLAEGQPWLDGENELLMKVMYRLSRDFQLRKIETWCLGDPEADQIAEDPEAFRGEILRLVGRVVEIETIRPVAEVARRFELDEYYRCRFLMGKDQEPALVFARTIPEAWKAAESVDERLGGYAIFLKLAGDMPEAPLPVFVASRIAWYPATKLGDLNMDAGLFDDLRPAKREASRGRPGEPGDSPKSGSPARRSLKSLRLTRRNRECFYQMLAAAGRAKPKALAADARKELKRTGRDRFSVVPLFNEPFTQHGRLVVLSGRARQVVPVRVSDADIVSRFGIDHYYQVFLFTDDSQGNPLVFCVREVPEGMPTGEGAQFGEQVTVSGFFFNTWAYRNREPVSGESASRGWQLAPLLIGRELTWHRQEERPNRPWLGLIAGGLFVAALLGIWLAVWRYNRGDAEFHKRTLARQFAPDSGVSFDDLIDE